MWSHVRLADMSTCQNCTAIYIQPLSILKYTHPKKTLVFHTQDAVRLFCQRSDLGSNFDKLLIQFYIILSYFFMTFWASIFPSISDWFSMHFGTLCYMKQILVFFCSWLRYTKPVLIFFCPVSCYMKPIPVLLCPSFAIWRQVSCPSPL